MDDRGESRVPSRRSADAQLAQLGESVEGLRDDIQDVRKAAVDGLKQLDDRVHQLEDVRVRALEDWRLKTRVLEDERSRVAQGVAQSSAHALSRRQFWAGLLVTAMISILTALIASGQLF